MFKFKNSEKFEAFTLFTENIEGEFSQSSDFFEIRFSKYKRQNRMDVYSKIKKSESNRFILEFIASLDFNFENGKSKVSINDAIVFNSDEFGKMIEGFNLVQEILKECEIKY